MSTKEQLQARKEAQEQLRKVLKPGQTVYTSLRHVSKSGMSRNISVVIVEAGEIREISWLVARALGDKIDPKTGGIKVSGCGMDMGFEVVYRLGYNLWPKGTPEAHGTRNGELDFAGGYALKQRWL